MNVFSLDAPLQLTRFEPRDAPLLVAYLSDPDIHRNTLRMPFPYTAEDAEAFLAKNFENVEKGVFTQFAVRSTEGLLLGCAGFLDLVPGIHKAEIGYWIAKPFWGQGVATSVVKGLVGIGFGEYGLKRICGITFEGNRASERVLEKCGFAFEGLMKHFIEKNGTLINARLYAITA